MNNLRKIFDQEKDKDIALTKIAHWYKEVEEIDFKAFNGSRTIVVEELR